MSVDPIYGLVGYLAADAGVSALVGTRVFGGELPRSENGSMPRQAVVVQPAGGGIMGLAYQDYGDFRVDVSCYGATPLDAWALYLAVHSALKSLRREVSHSALLHWARPSSKGLSGRDTDTDWPLVISSWQVFAAEVTAA